MKILYFSWLRTRVGRAEEEVSPPSHIRDIAGLIEWLRLRGPGYAAALENMTVVRVALNQEHVDLSAPINPGDEVAFFPPVTGGGAL